PRGKTVVNANTCSAFTYVAVTTVLPLLHNGNTVPAWPAHRDGPCRFGNFAKSFITPTGSSFFLLFLNYRPFPWLVVAVPAIQDFQKLPEPRALPDDFITQPSCHMVRGDHRAQGD